MSDQPCCACRRVLPVTTHHDDGTCSEHWECDSCHTRFMRVPHFDALRAEVEKLRAVALVARETRDAMDITLSSDDLDGEWEFENTVPIWHDRLADRLRSLDAYRASQADTLIKRTIVDSKEIIDGLAQADKGGEGET